MYMYVNISIYLSMVFARVHDSVITNLQLISGFGSTCYESLFRRQYGCKNTFIPYSVWHSLQILTVSSYCCLLVPRAATRGGCVPVI